LGIVLSLRLSNKLLERSGFAGRSATDR